MTITETPDYIIIGELAPDSEIESNYTEIAAAFKENYIESSDVLEHSSKFLSDSIRYAGDSGFCIALFASFLVLLSFHIANSFCSALSPRERG